MSVELIRAVQLARVALGNERFDAAVTPTHHRARRTRPFRPVRHGETDRLSVLVPMFARWQLMQRDEVRGERRGEMPRAPR